MPYAYIPDNAISAMPRLSGSAVKVMNAIASFMPGRGAGCYPSLAAIGERAGIKREKTISAALKELIAAGVVTCERRKRQTNLLKWASLDRAESAGTRILDPAVSAPLNPLEPAEIAPLGTVLEPAVSAQVYPAVSAPRKDTKEGYKTTIAQNDEKRPSSSAPAAGFPNPNSESNPKGKSSTQGNQTPSLSLPRTAGDEGKASLPPKVTWDGTRIIVPDVFMESWGESYPCVDLPLAIKRASSWCLSNPAKRPKKDYGAFMNRWLGKVRPGSPEYIDPKEQAADDADLIRQAEEAFPDPVERAGFFWQRQRQGLRVPSGVECKPTMEDLARAAQEDKEVAV